MFPILFNLYTLRSNSISLNTISGISYTESIFLYKLYLQKLKMKKQMTLVYYYVPEDKDDPQVPNVFGVNVKKDDMRLKHLYENFPISGQYIFRFKVLYENNIAWLDLPDSNAKLPTFKEKIMVKASRISWQNKRPVPENKNSQAQHQNKVLNSTLHSTQQKFQSADHKPEIGANKSPLKAENTKKPQQSFNLIDDEHLNHGNQLL